MSATTFKFKAGGYFIGIEKVECVSETEKTVTIREKLFRNSPPKESRHPKTSAKVCYHDTWIEAKAMLLRRAESKVLSARRSLELAQAELGNIKGMKHPKDAA